MRCAGLAILLGSTVFVGCCHTCPRPSIVGIPPAGAERVELPLPLDAAAQTKLEAYLLHCGPAGGGICENQLSLEQTCAIQKLRGALPPSSKDAAKALAACSGTPEFTLQIRDARVAAADDLRGAVVDRFVFVVHPNDPATGVAVLSVFADYVPVATP